MSFILTTIAPVVPYGRAAETMQNRAKGALQYLTDTAKPLSGLALGGTLLATAVGVGFGGAAGAQLTPDGSLDKVFKAMMFIVAPVLAILGVKNIWSVNSRLNEANNSFSGSLVTIKDDNASTYLNTENNLNARKITGLDNDPSQRKSVIFQLANTQNILEEIGSTTQILSEDGPEFGIENMGELRVSKIKEDLAILLGYYVATTGSGDDPLDFINTGIIDAEMPPTRKNHLRDELIRKLLNPGGIDSTSPEAKFLTKDFLAAYNAARFYTTNLATVDSIEDLLKLDAQAADPNITLSESDLRDGINNYDVLDSSDTTKRDQVKAYLHGKVRDTGNSLRTLKSTLEFIRENQDSQNEEVARRVAILQAAIVAGFRIQGDGDRVRAEIGNLLEGVTDSGTNKPGILKKVNDFEVFKSSNIDPLVNNGKKPDYVEKLVGMSNGPQIALFDIQLT